MSSDIAPDVSALAINVTIPQGLRWTDTRRGEEFTLTTLNVRLLPDGRLAAKAYGRPAGGGRGTYVSFPVPDRPELATLIVRAASRAGALWAAHCAGYSAQGAGLGGQERGGVSELQLTGVSGRSAPPGGCTACALRRR
jgi:hypothetical protein